LSRPPSPDAAAGFTLIEALAALTIAALGLGALAELTHSTIRTTLFAERRVELISTARKAWAALPARVALGEGQTHGELNGKVWRMSVAPYVGPAVPSEAAGWRPERIAIEVRAADGERIELETVRLQRAATP